MTLPSRAPRAVANDVTDRTSAGPLTARTRWRRGWAGVVAGAVVVATPALGPWGPAGASAAPDAKGGSFTSSFESADAPVDWTSTVEGDRSEGISGPAPSGLPGNITDQVSAVTASAENPPGETAVKAADGDPNTKWLAFATTGWVAYAFDAPQTVKRYALTSANDSPERDPADWTLQGSDDGTTWTTLDSQTGQTFAEPLPDQDLRDREHDGVRALPARRHEGGRRLDPHPARRLPGLRRQRLPPGPEDMVAAVGTGPTSAYNAKANVGFTGLKALRYAGTRTGAGRGYSYNKVFDVDVAVGRRHRAVLPDLPGAHRRRPAATRARTPRSTSRSPTAPTCRDLGAARRPARRRLSPRAQGDSQDALRQPVERRRVARSARSPPARRSTGSSSATTTRTGPADFGGWFDDIVVDDAKPVTAPRPTRLRRSPRAARNASGGFSRGNNFPATAVPHGFNFWTPVTDAGSTSWLYEYHASNNADNRPTLQAFSAQPRAQPVDGRPADASRSCRRRRPARRTPTGRPARWPSGTRTRSRARTTTASRSTTG